MRWSNRLGAAILACALLAASGSSAEEVYEYETRPSQAAVAAEFGKGLLAGAIILGRLGAKAGYAAAGTGVATLAWAFSGGRGEVFSAIAKPAWGGDWVITREQAFFQKGSDFFGSKPQQRVNPPTAPQPAPLKAEPRWTRDIPTEGLGQS